MAAFAWTHAWARQKRKHNKYLVQMNCKSLIWLEKIACLSSKIWFWLSACIYQASQLKKPLTTLCGTFLLGNFPEQRHAFSPSVKIKELKTCLISGHLLHLLWLHLTVNSPGSVLYWWWHHFFWQLQEMRFSAENHHLNQWPDTNASGMD